MANSEIVCRLEQLLRQRNWSVLRLKRESGISYPTLHALAHNRTRMYRADVLSKLCRTLRCQPGDLLVFQASKKKQLPSR
jgi:putative transcriptional regulator